MDRRRQARYQQCVQVRIIDLDSGRDAEGKTLDFSEDGVGIFVPIAFPLGSLLKIELPDALMLGEVLHVRPAEGGFQIGMRISHRLRGLNQYKQLRDAMRA